MLTLLQTPMDHRVKKMTSTERYVKLAFLKAKIIS